VSKLDGGADDELDPEIPLQREIFLDEGADDGTDD
jgi:hypothetical protein